MTRGRGVGGGCGDVVVSDVVWCGVCVVEGGG